VSAEQKTLEGLDEFVAARQMRPGSLEIEKLCLYGGIRRLLGAPPAIGRTITTRRNMFTQYLKHFHAIHVR
jgi:hypothetical protein